MRDKKKKKKKGHSIIKSTDSLDLTASQKVNFKTIFNGSIKIFFSHSAFPNAGGADNSRVQSSNWHRRIPLREPQAASAESSGLRDHHANTNSYALRFVARVPNTVTMQKHQPHCIRYKCDSTGGLDDVSTKSKPQYTSALRHFSQSWRITGISVD